MRAIRSSEKSTVNECTESSEFRILIVIPTLGDRLDTLARALESIHDQACASADVIIISKEISDSLNTLADRYGAKVVQHPGHISAAVNAGFNLATEHHRYAGWIGDDDLLRPCALSTASAMMEKNPEASVCYGSCDYIDMEGKLMFNRSPPIMAPLLLYLIPGLIKQEACLFRLSALRMVGGLNEQLKYSMDLDLLLRLQRIGPFLKSKHIHAAFCWHPGSLTVSNRYASLEEAQHVQYSHMHEIVRRLAPLWRKPIRHLIHAKSMKINQGLSHPERKCAQLFNRQLLKFILVGLGNTTFSYSVYAAFLYIGLVYWMANLWALVFGIAFSYMTHGSLVFHNVSRSTFIRFVTAWVFIYFINTAFISIFIRMSISNYLAGAIATIPAIASSYFILKFFVFIHKNQTQTIKVT